MGICITKAQNYYLNNFVTDIEKIKKHFGIDENLIEQWEVESPDFLLAKQFYMSLLSAQTHGRNCVTILAAIKENIEIEESD